MHDRAAIIAAVGNASVVLLLPLGLMLLGNVLPDRVSDTSITVRPDGTGRAVMVTLVTWFYMCRALLPFALIAGWRTLVHARRRAAGTDRSWVGVLEAGACGFVCALLILAPGIVRTPTHAPPYLVVYGGIALVVGLIVGLALRATALVILKFAPRGVPES